MKVGLRDVDGHHFPNLCLMKLSAYHKARGDTVEWHDGRKHYDLVYMSRVFTDTYSKDYMGMVRADKVIRGGTGYGLENRLPDEVEHTYPDYSLYPQFAGTAYGFLVATHFFRPQITLVACHRINRYNDMRTEKGKGSRTPIFSREP